MNGVAHLKQFIDARLSQSEQSFDSKIDEKLGVVETRLTKKIDDLSDSVAQAVDTSNEETEKQLKDHEQRITKLEAA